MTVPPDDVELLRRNVVHQDQDVERRPLLPHHDLGPAEVVQLLTNAEDFRMCDGPPCLCEPPLGRCRVEVADVAPDLAAGPGSPSHRTLAPGPGRKPSSWKLHVFQLLGDFFTFTNLM
jgi:hypothetical protein